MIFHLNLIMISMPCLQAFSVPLECTVVKHSVSNPHTNLVYWTIRRQKTQASRLSSIPTYINNLAPNGKDALSNKFLPRVVKCEECQKVLETPDDIKWHYETTYGKEDCKILKSMLWSTSFSTLSSTPNQFYCIYSLFSLKDCCFLLNK